VKILTCELGYRFWQRWLWSSVFWDLTQCSPVDVYRRFGWTYHLHLQGRRVIGTSNQQEAGGK
jgi:hypothetical protein